jgi:ferritin
MIDEKMQRALNEQLNYELFSSYLYLSMSSYFDSKNLLGFANWMRVQAQEELAHVMKFFDYVKNRGGRVLLSGVDGPQTEWDSPLAIFEQALEHEVSVSSRINKLVDLSLELSDHATNAFLQWFVSEQVEEEASVDEVVQKLKMVGGEGYALFMIDRELATRTFVSPPADA